MALHILRDLGEGLIVRRATTADSDTLAALNGEIFEPIIGATVGRIARGESAIGSIESFTVVEDTATGAIVSSLGLFSLRVTYAGIPLAVGLPDYVLTRPAYRRRGLVRAQFSIIHEWSAARGDLMQIIQGIPSYYRQFGYEYAIEHDAAQIGTFADVPPLAEGQAEPYRLCPATPDDLPVVARIADAAERRYLIARHRDDAYWRALFQRIAAGSPTAPRTLTIEDSDGALVGFVRHNAVATGDQLTVLDYEVLPGHSWFAVTPTVLRYLRAVAAHLDTPATRFVLDLGGGHPAYQVMREHARPIPPSAWYVRVPDLPRLLNHIAPVLEARLAALALTNHTGDVTISFYNTGLRLTFDHGRITAAPWRPIAASSEGSFSLAGDGSNVSFPGNVFVQLLCGYRNLDDLEYAYADCGHDTDQTHGLLDALFPRAVSHISSRTA